jgi:hypothetical protein
MVHTISRDDPWCGMLCFHPNRQRSDPITSPSAPNQGDHLSDQKLNARAAALERVARLQKDDRQCIGEAEG